MIFNKLTSYDTFRWKRVKDAEFDGKYDMPKLSAVHNVKPMNLVPFHMAISTKSPSDCWYHFYEDDYQFERFWNKPDRYLPILKRFAGGISTDFSIYLDMPRGQQIWNCWRNRAMAYYMQANGLQIIPNVGWSDEESLTWAFDGIPEGSVLSITTQSCMGRDYYCRQTLLNGLHELARQKHPEEIIVYGKFPEKWKERFPMPIVVYNSFAEEKWGA